jgi:putative transposase
MSEHSIRTIYFASKLPREVMDALNRESGRIYTQIKVEQYRIYRKKGIWLSPNAQERYNDYLNADAPRLLHAHSVDAAQQGFNKACKTAKANRNSGAKYPHRNKRYRTTTWKPSGIRIKDGCLILSLAKGLTPLSVPLPNHLRDFPKEAFLETRLVYNKSSRRYEWHLVVDTGVEVKPLEQGYVAAIDLGEIHPVTITDGRNAAVISCRELRAVRQHTNYVLSKIGEKQARHKKYSRRWWRLQRRKNRFLARQKKRVRDLEHKISRKTIEWAQAHEVSEIAIGDVRDVADGKRLNKKSQQKVSNWSHGKMRKFIGYKAQAAGMKVAHNVDESYTSQTCCGCGERHKPKGRIYQCPVCGFVAHRDVQGAANILSRYVTGELGKVTPPIPMYRYPVLRGKRSSPGHGANSSRSPVER